MGYGPAFDHEGGVAGVVRRWHRAEHAARPDRSEGHRMARRLPVWLARDPVLPARRVARHRIRSRPRRGRAAVPGRVGTAPTRRAAAPPSGPARREPDVRAWQVVRGTPESQISFPPLGVLDTDDMGGDLHSVLLLHRLVLRGHVGRVDQQPGQVGMHGLGGQDRVSLILSESDIGLPVELMWVESVLLRNRSRRAWSGPDPVPRRQSLRGWLSCRTCRCWSWGPRARTGTCPGSRA